MKPNQTLSSLLKKAGFNSNEVSEAIKSKKKIFPGKYKLRANDTYLTAQNPTTRSLVLYDHTGTKSYVLAAQGKTIFAKSLDLPYDRKVVTVRGQIFGSLIESIKKKSQVERLAYRFLDAYALLLNPMKRKLKRLKKGDAFSLSYEKLFLGKTFIRNGEVLSTSLEYKGKHLEKKFVSFNDGGVFINSNDLRSKKDFFAPVSYISVSSPFNPRRFHPIKKRRQPHWGIDFELPIGSPIFATKKAVVANFGRTRAGGYFVRLDHGGGYESLYNHMNKIDTNLVKGQSIPAGALIGEVGCTGYCTRPHLHFGIRKNGRFIDPAPMIRPYPYHYRKKLRQEFAARPVKAI